MPVRQLLKRAAPSIYALALTTGTLVWLTAAGKHVPLVWWFIVVAWFIGLQGLLVLEYWLRRRARPK